MLIDAGEFFSFFCTIDIAIIFGRMIQNRSMRSVLTLEKNARSTAMCAKWPSMMYDLLIIPYQNVFLHLGHSNMLHALNSAMLLCPVE